MSSRTQTAAPETRIEALKSRHGLYKMKIKELESKPAATTDYYLGQIKALKREKLKVKEEIERLRRAKAH